MSQLQVDCEDPDKVAHILNNIHDVALNEDDGHVPSILQEVFEDCDELFQGIILDDKNIPNIRDLCFDLNLMSPLSQIFQHETFIAASANKMLKYISSLSHTVYNHQMLMMSFRMIAEG